jgi:hypothetical protein
VEYDEIFHHHAAFVSGGGLKDIREGIAFAANIVSLTLGLLVPAHENVAQAVPLSLLGIMVILTRFKRTESNMVYDVVVFGVKDNMVNKSLVVMVD